MRVRAEIAKRCAQLRAPGAKPAFLLITGGKGGVGKTTLAANLAVCLAREEARPLLVDLDFGLANLDVILGVHPGRTVEAFFSGEHELSECIEQGPSGLRVLFAGSGVPSSSSGRARTKPGSSPSRASRAARGLCCGCPPEGRASNPSTPPDGEFPVARLGTRSRLVKGPRAFRRGVERAP